MVKVMIDSLWTETPPPAPPLQGEGRQASPPSLVEPSPSTGSGQALSLPKGKGAGELEPALSEAEVFG